MPATSPRNDRDLAAFVRDRELPAELVRPGGPTRTVPDAARVLGVEARAIIKSLVFEVDSRALLVIVAGEARVRMGTLARALGVSRRRVRLTSPEEALAITGFQVGSMPPFGHRRALDTLVDSASVPEEGVVYGGGGGPDVLLRLPASTLDDVTQARRLPLTVAVEDGAKELKS